MSDESIVDEINKLSTENLLKIGGVTLIMYFGYRVIKKITEPKEAER